MSRSPRAARPAPWKISSVYVRRRDGPKRIEQPHRILIDEFLASGAAEDRLKLEQLPGYAPDLNPDEGVWKHLNYVELKNLSAARASQS
jgi:transposase